MAHPFQAHRQSKVEHARVGRITRGYADGGGTHDDAAADRAMIKRMVKSSALMMDGDKANGRQDRPHRAKGGRVKGGKPVNVNVIVAPQGGDDKLAALAGLAGGPGAMPPPAMAPMPPKMPMPPMAGPMAGGPPGLPPGGPAPIRSSGGRAYAKGGRVKRADGGRSNASASLAGDREQRKFRGTMKPFSGPPNEQESAEREASGYKRGGKVNPGPAFNEGRREGTPAKHDAEKGKELANLGRGRPITYKTGGPINAPRKGGMGPKLSGGARGGEARLEKAERARKTYAKAR